MIKKLKELYKKAKEDKWITILFFIATIPTAIMGLYGLYQLYKINDMYCWACIAGMLFFWCIMELVLD